MAASSRSPQRKHTAAEYVVGTSKKYIVNCDMPDIINTNKIIVKMQTAMFKQEILIHDANDVFCRNFGYMREIPSSEKSSSSSSSSSASPISAAVSSAAVPSSLEAAASVSPSFSTASSSAAASLPTTIAASSSASSSSLAPMIVEVNGIEKETSTVHSVVGLPLQQIIDDKGKRETEDDLTYTIGCHSSHRIVTNIMHSMTSGSACTFYCTLLSSDETPLLCHLQCVPLAGGQGLCTVPDILDNSLSAVSPSSNTLLAPSEECWAMLNIHFSSLVAGAAYHGYGYGLDASYNDCPHVCIGVNHNFEQENDEANAENTATLHNPCPQGDRNFGLFR